MLRAVQRRFASVAHLKRLKGFNPCVVRRVGGCTVAGTTLMFSTVYATDDGAQSGDDESWYDDDDYFDDDEDEVQGSDVASMATLMSRGLEHPDVWISLLATLPVFLILFIIPVILRRTAYDARLLTRRINVSLNNVTITPSGDVRLKLRTLQEFDVSRLMHNQVGIRQLLQAATTTVTTSSPFIRLPEHHRWTWYNQVLNELSSYSAAAHLAEDMGLPVHTTTYVMALTREPDTVVASKKIRVLLVRKDVLRQLADLDGGEPVHLENPRHEVRWATLRQMARVHFEEELAEIAAAAAPAEAAPVASATTDTDVDKQWMAKVRRALRLDAADSTPGEVPFWVRRASTVRFEEVELSVPVLPK